MFLEIMFDQGPAALEMSRGFDAFESPRILKDHAGNDRVLTVKRKSQTPV